jgi:primosomal protein N'
LQLFAIGLTGTGGAERVVLELHKMFPDAPIYTSQYDKNPKPGTAIEWFADADVRHFVATAFSKIFKKINAGSTRKSI